MDQPAPHFKHGYTSTAAYLPILLSTRRAILITGILMLKTAWCSRCTKAIGKNSIDRGNGGARDFNTLNLLQPTGHVMHQQFNIQQMYALPTLYLCVLYLSENKQRLVPLTA